tara:strand:- start:210 stop:557 length:348 start_codon:yes stop_codon:yes gene_type:complete
MDIFETDNQIFDSSNDNDNNNNLNVNNNIEIIVESRGRKKNTYLTGWINDINVLKEHLKKLKREIGCNGSVKSSKNDKNKLVFHLQGDRRDKLFEYLTNAKYNNNIDPQFITIRG